jgi:DNA-binding NtrC family response regulator
MKEVLFVDDERSVLVALERMLRPHRDRWNMTFVEGGVEALAHLERRPVDVVVTDMRMPGMDGSALLEIVRELHPDTVRIVLSGELEADGAVRIADLAHHRLHKPCDPAAIVGALEGACAKPN